MSEVKRYEPDGGRGECYMSQKYDGDYVHYSDYQTLESENARLREALAGMILDHEIWKRDGCIATFPGSASFKRVEAARAAISKEDGNG